MTRVPVVVRDAVPADAEALAALWDDVLRRTDAEGRRVDVLEIIERAAGSRTQRVLVADCDGVVAGGAHLSVDTLTPINLEPVLRVVSPHVASGYRRRGVGSALMDAAVSHAEELGIGHVASAAAAGSRDANRFMARLSLGPQAMLRVGATVVVRQRLGSRRPAAGGRGQSGRQLERMLAVRRSRRREEMPS